MMMAVSLLSPQDEESWNDFVLSHPSSTIYHTLEWREVSLALNHRPLYLVVKDGRGIMQGAFPLFHLAGLRGSRLISVPLRDRGGPLCANDEILGELLQAAINLAAERNCKYVGIKTMGGLPQVAEQLGFVEKTHYLTTVVPLSADVERLWKGLDYGGVRWGIKKAEKKGLRTRWANGQPDIGHFYKVFLRTRKRLGIPPYSISLFEKIWNEMQGQGRASFLLATYENRVIGGLVLLSFKDRVIEAYAASDERYLSLCANDLLLWRAIEWAAASGYHYFDFGASSPYQKGLRDFKSKWGGYELGLPFYFYLSRRGTVPIVDSNKASYRMFRGIWSKMPAPFARAIGPLIAKQMD